MRRIEEKSRSSELPPVVLWLDQLEQIFEHLPSAADLSLRSGDYAFENLDDLKTSLRGRTIYELEISSLRPYFSLRFGRSLCRIYAGDRDAYPIFYETERIIKQNQRKFPILYRTLPWIVAIAIINLTGYSSLHAVISNAIFIVVYTRSAIIANFRHSTIYIEYKSNRSNFFERHRETIISNVIAAVVGGIIVAVATSSGVVQAISAAFRSALDSN